MTEGAARTARLAGSPRQSSLCACLSSQTFVFGAPRFAVPDFSNQDDLAKLGAEAFAFVNVARFAIPLRIGLALSTTPWVQDNIVDKFGKKDE